MASHSGEMAKTAMRAKGMTQTELARRIGRDQTLISRFLAGQIEISFEAARSIAEELEIESEDFLHQLQLDKYNRKAKHLKAGYRKILDEGVAVDIPTPDELIHVGNVDIVETDIIAVPLLNSVPTGAHDRSKEGSKPYILPPSIRVDTEKSFALRISGENMTDDKVDEGDIIVIDPGAEGRDGDRVLVILNREPMLRKIYRTGETVMLQSPENRAESVIFLSQKDDFEVVGKVVLCTKLFT